MADAPKPDFLTRLARRALGLTPLARPRILPRFADQENAAGWLEFPADDWDDGEAIPLLEDDGEPGGDGGEGGSPADGGSDGGAPGGGPGAEGPGAGAPGRASGGTRTDGRGARAGSP